MKWTIVLVTTLLLVSVQIGATTAVERWRIASVPLDMPLSDDEALDNQALEGLYQGDYGRRMTHNLGGYLGGNVRESGLNESPFYRINTTLKDGRKLELWFSSADDGHKTFGVYLDTPWNDKPIKDFKQAADEAHAAFGKPDLAFAPADRSDSQKIEIFADRMMPKARYDAVIARLPKAAAMGKKEVDGFWESDLRNWARILGPDFRGAIVIFGLQKNKLVSEDVYLIDLVRAKTVFNLERIN
ncbi:MAG TPA: hypothetical protein VMB26_11865 [Candidatus Binataceae bacterium]|nr:hypothetical protein [Candidatus Binataceae bacterium]